MEIFKKALFVFDKKQKIRLIELIILILIGTGLETVGVTAIVPFISALMYPENLLENKYALLVYQLLDLKNTNQFIIIMALALIVVFVIKNIYLCFMYSAQYRFVFNNQKRLANELMSCYIRQPYRFHLSHNSAELIHNITQDVDTFFATVLQAICLITDICVCLSLVVVLLVVDKTITISVAGLVFLVVLLFYGHYKKKILYLGNERRKYATKNTKCIQQAFGGIKEIKILGRERYFVNSYEEQYEFYANSRKKVSTYAALPKPIMETMCVVALLLVIAFKIARGVEVEYFIPTLSVFAMAVIRILPSSSRISANLNNIAYGKSSVEAIYEDISAIRKISNQVEDCTDKGSLFFDKEISVEHLTFHYDESEKLILNDVSLKIPKNKSVAFVGTSGSGKTTLADVILGVLEFQKGRILIDDKDMSKCRRQWQDKIGYIPQNIYILDDTIRRNIAFALADEVIDDAKIWKAIDEAQLREFVENLSDGLDTVIGEWGSRISGGQRQRIGIARALYHNPEVLVLDEATSALDQETERAVMEAIDSLSGSKTLIIIAHRLSTIENCNMIYRVENGNVILEKND